jgi:hypothetical protein
MLSKLLIPVDLPSNSFLASSNGSASSISKMQSLSSSRTQLLINSITSGSVNEADKLGGA